LRKIEHAAAMMENNTQTAAAIEICVTGKSFDYSDCYIPATLQEAASD